MATVSNFSFLIFNYSDTSQGYKRWLLWVSPINQFNNKQKAKGAQKTVQCIETIHMRAWQGTPIKKRAAKQLFRYRQIRKPKTYHCNHGMQRICTGVRLRHKEPSTTFKK